MRGSMIFLPGLSRINGVGQSKGKKNPMSMENWCFDEGKARTYGLSALTKQCSAKIVRMGQFSHVLLSRESMGNVARINHRIGQI
jgi:hypothetical protein